MTLLSRIFERERPLIYFTLWNASDREGCELFTQQTISHNLFISQPKEHTGSVWYSEQELEKLEVAAEARINAEPELGERMIAHARKEWKILEPYAKAEKRIESGHEYLEVYRALTSFWYTMNTVYYRLPERPSVNEHFTSQIYRLRDDTQEYSGPLSQYMKTYFEALFPVFARYSMCVTPEDVVEVMEGSGEMLKDVLEDRLQYGCFLLNGVLYPYSKLDEELKKCDLQLESFDTSGTEVKGSIGFKGVVRGPVRVIRKFSDLENVQEGEVLVANLTEPSYIVAMQKVAAFVTNEGGIMSHAAIVAREMKKPCVIGTKIATEVFKDGDVVEVDAEKGIVRKV